MPTTSVTAVNGSQGYEDERFIDPRQAAKLSAQRLRSFRREQSPFYVRSEDVGTSQRRMGQQLTDFDTLFAAAGARR